MGAGDIITPVRRTCGTMDVHNAQLESNPEYAARRREIEVFSLDVQARRAARVQTIRIPVVVHVVLPDPTVVSDAQVQSQIEALNRDYRFANADRQKIPAPFAPLAVDCRIEFALARLHPNGSATSGITRTATTQAGFGQDHGVKFAARGGHDAWPADRYLNVWVCQLTGGLLGYATFPGGDANIDGVVITHSGFGTLGTARAPFNLGRTATHEVGHWLNLLHIWGDDNGGCDKSDNVADTPNQAQENYNKPVFPHVSCGNAPAGDMFMNYMDYVDDDAMFMFTTGQLARMEATLVGPRASITTSDALGVPAPVPDLALQPRLLGVLAGGETELRPVPTEHSGRQPKAMFDGARWVPTAEFLARLSESRAGRASPAPHR